MTDSTGIFQHAGFTEPNLAEGYCTDDNARALILAVLLGQMEDAPRRVRTLASTYAAFLKYAFDPKTGRFHNFLGLDRCWLDELGSEDAHGRTTWALGTALALATLEFAGVVGMAIHARLASRDALHLATGLGVQSDRNRRVSQSLPRRATGLRMLASSFSTTKTVRRTTMRLTPRTTEE